MASTSTRAEAFDLKQSSTASDALEASKSEHDMTFWQAVRIHRKAVVWSAVVSLATIMDGYDLQIITAFYSYPSFQKKYGVQLDDGSHSIPASWQLGLNLASNFGLIVGGFLNGWLVELVGPRRMMICSYISLAGFIFISFFAASIEVLLVGCVLCGLPWGVFATIAPLYAAEVCPLVLRSYLTTYVSATWIVGRMIGTGVLQGMIHDPTEWSYRVPFALQWIWPIPLALAVYFAPESPWWQVRSGRLAAAEATIRRLTSRASQAKEGEAARQAVAMMAHTLQTEKNLNIGSNYIDCFRGTNLRRTEIASISWGGQLLTGFAIQNYMTYFFTLAGLASSNALKLSLGVFGAAFVCTVFSWLLQSRFGRRQIYVAGLCTLTPIMLLVALLDFSTPSSARYWGQCSVIVVWYAIYGLSVGPIPFAIATEVPASRLRTKTIAISRNTYYALSTINIVVTPYLLNPTEANLKGKAAFPAAGLSLALLVWAWFRLPETKGRTFEELDIMFEKKTPARLFSSVVFDPNGFEASHSSKVENLKC